MKLFVLIFCAVVTISAHKQINLVAKHEAEDWWEHGVFYQIYPKSFKDSTGNDGIGDLKGIIEKLQHLKDLGVTGTWLSPIFKSPQKDGGYDIQDFRNVDEMFGTNEDLQELFRKAKELDIKIILDFVPNHTSDQHEWFIKSVNRQDGYDDWYVWEDCTIDVENPENNKYPNNWIAVFHTPAWTYHPARNQCYLHQFAVEQPDLNYRNPLVRQEMISTLKYWLEQGADGFRIDAINHMYETVGLPDEAYKNPNGDLTDYENLVHNHTMNLAESYQFIYDVRTMMDDFVANEATEKHTRLMMTEAYATIPEQILWYGVQTGSETTLGSHMPFNFALISDLTKESSASQFKTAIDSWIDEMPSYGKANWVLGNHDRSRIGSRYGAERHESLAIMTMMLPGINVVYNGEEILMLDHTGITWAETQDPAACNTNETVYQQTTRDPVRTPFQWDNTSWAGFSNTKTWLPVNPNYLQVNLAAQVAAEKSTFKLYQKLIALRKSSHTLQTGDFTSKVVSNNVFAFTRKHEGENTIAVFVNIGSAASVNLTDLIIDEYKSETKAKILIANNACTLPLDVFLENLGAIQLGQYDAIVIEVSSATKLSIPLLLLISCLIKFFF